MTEEDTFRALRRISFEEMMALRTNFWAEWMIADYNKRMSLSYKSDVMFVENGWTDREYTDEFDRREKLEK